MKRRTILILLISVIPLLSFSQESVNTVMIRVVESWTTNVVLPVYPSKILISYSNGRGREIALHNKGDKKFAENTKIIHDTLIEFLTDDYEIISEMCSGGDYVNNYVWIFREVGMKNEN